MSQDSNLANAIKEQVRQRTLDDYEIVDTAHEEEFDDLVALASYICGTPISAISLIDRERQWFKASVGLGESQTPRDISFCQHTIHEEDLFVVPNALEDERFAESPLVLEGPKIRFYAGAPLIAPNGSAIGALCVKDVTPRELSPDQADALRRLARQVVCQLELRKTNRGLAKQTTILEENSADLRVASAEATEANRQAQEAIAELRAGQERFELVCNATDDVIWDINLVSGEVWVSENYGKKFLGTSENYTPTEEDWKQSVHPEDRERVTSGMAEAVSSGASSWAAEYRHKAPNGAYIDVFDRAFVMKDGEGHPIRIVGAMMDITEQKRVEGVERANAAKNQFLSRMSHELRTPLNSILGFAQLLEIYDPTEKQKECIALILQGGKHLLGLINEILDISRIESGNMSISKEPVCVNEVAQQAISLAAPMAQLKHVALEIADDCAKECYVLADRQRLLQVLINLISNAVKYNVENGRVELSFVVTDGVVRLSVTDTGEGIDAQMAERVFMPFDRLGADLRGAVEGTGLGLALSKNLTEAMGGKIWFHSVVGQGSSFFIELPEAENPSLRILDLKTSPAIGASTHMKKLLYIEDNRPNVILMEQVIASRPEWSLRTAERGMEGLKMLAEEPADLILLDLDLPDIEGMEVLRRLRCQLMTSRIPVLVVSADATPGRVHKLQAAGANGYVTKPFDVKDLLTRIQEIFQQEAENVA